MTAQVFEFPRKEGIAWHHIAVAVHQAAMERSGSREIADRVVETVRQAYERSVPPSFAFKADSVESMREDATAHLHHLVGTMLSEMTTFATDAEMLAADHDPHNHRGR